MDYFPFLNDVYLKRLDRKDALNMPQSFTHSAENLQSFFSQPGRGFYVPYYQRNFSWDEENAQKLVTDIFEGIKRTLTKPNNSIFLGTVILHDERNVTVGIHTDTPNLLTKVYSVVDGQQRITSIAMLACVMTEKIKTVASQLEALAASAQEFQALAGELRDELPNLQEFFTVEIRKNGAQPRLKPLIIRAGDVSVNPVSDQWTLSGNLNLFYRSNTSRFLSSFVSGTPIGDIPSDDRISSVVEVFKDTINDEIEKASFNLASALLNANNIADGSLSNFMAYPPDLSNLQALPVEAQSAFYGGTLLLAACSFLKNSCHLVVIECLDIGLAFDMFQSLNATGTPLTAFEVFKPMIVNTWGPNYSTAIKPQVDRIEAIFETESTADGKEQLTDKVIVSSALVFNGQERSRRFSDERDWLMETFEGSLVQAGNTKITTQQSVDFVTCLADQADYHQNFIIPKRPRKNSTSFDLLTHLQGLGLTTEEAETAALCVFFVRDAGHQFAHSVLGVFYSKLFRAQPVPASRPTAVAEFVSVCKSVAAFFTFWMGALQGRFPDSDYRSLFQSGIANISFANGAANQNAAFVKNAFRIALANQGIYDANNQLVARQMWVDRAKNVSWYSRKAVCKFALFIAAHDAAPDTAMDRAGLFVDGMPNSAVFLNCKAWHSGDYECIEHIATRDRPNTINFPDHFDSAIYPGNNSIVDKIGNLTLLSIPVNSSIYSEWPDKVFYYWSLTTPSSTVAGPNGTALSTALGLTGVPPGLASLAASSNYLPHLAPLALRGQLGMKWNSALISERSEHLCGRIFDKIDGWLR